MSDNPPDAAPQPDADADPKSDAPENTAPDQAPPSDAPEGDKAASDAAPADDKPDDKPRPSQGDRRFARITAMLASEKAAREEAERRAAAAEALLNPEAKKDAPPTPKATQAEIQAAARQLVAQETFVQRQRALIAEGAKELGAALWDEKTSLIGQLGAYENEAFMQAIVEIPGGHKVVAALADDADRLAALLDKSPVALAAELGRMAAELNAAPKPKAAVSNAPRPVPPGGGRTQAAPDIYDTKTLSEAEWMALRNKTAPRHLGGMGKEV